MKSILFTLLFIGSLVHADNGKIYVIADLYATDTTGFISGNLIFGSPRLPTTLVEWEHDGYEILIPLADIPNNHNYMIGTVPLGGTNINAYWGDPACLQYLALIMFETENTAVRTGPGGPYEYIVYVIGDEDISSVTDYYLRDSNNTCNGPYISEVPLKLGEVLGVLLTLEENYQFIITAEDDSKRDAVFPK